MVPIRFARSLSRSLSRALFWRRVTWRCVLQSREQVHTGMDAVVSSLASATSGELDALIAGMPAVVLARLAAAIVRPNPVFSDYKNSARDEKMVPVYDAKVRRRVLSRAAAAEAAEWSRMATAKSIVDAPDHTSQSKRQRRFEVSPNAACMQALPYDLLLRVLMQVCPASLQPQWRYDGTVMELGRFVRVSKMFSVVVAPGTRSVVGDALHRRAVMIARKQARSECNEDAFATDAFATSLPEGTSPLGVRLLGLVQEYNKENEVDLLIKLQGPEAGSRPWTVSARIRAYTPLSRLVGTVCQLITGLTPVDIDLFHMRGSSVQKTRHRIADVAGASPRSLRMAEGGDKTAHLLMTIGSTAAWTHVAKYIGCMESRGPPRNSRLFSRRSRL